MTNMKMINANKILGNIRSNRELSSKYQEMSKVGNVEKISVSRLESDRLRMRKVSDKGTELALTLPPGSCLNHDDVVLLTGEKMVVVQREPENVALVTVRKNIPEDHILETAVKIGHTIGNLHRPLRVEGNKITFPIQASSEIQLFEKLLSPFKDHLDIKSDNMIFEPEQGYNVHEH
jgi:urease accessory protein